MKTRILALGLFVFPILSLAQQPVPSVDTTNAVPPRYLDPSLPIDTRVADLASRMTLEEKVSQMQDVAPAIPRLQIPAYNWWNEGLHGVARAGIATVFPQAIGLAATWDDTLVERVADVISTEARAKYNDAQLHNNTARYYGLTFWSPNVNIFRDPRWGRGQETYGEDPFLTARLGVAFVTGLQGNDPHYLKTVATPKHYAVHSGPETIRHRFNVPVSLHDLYDTYTPAFRATVVDGHADSIMCAYNRVLGEPACASQLLYDLLRNQWGFKGFVVSDCGAVSDLYAGHYFTLSLDQASAVSAKAGTDLSCGTEYSVLAHAERDRLISMPEIDRAVSRLFEARFRLGMFDPPANSPWSKLTLADVDTPAHRKLALDAARESIVLLKNDRNTLPLNASKTRSIAVVGPTADSLDVLLGNYNGTPSAYTTILAGIQKRFGKAKINYAVGAPITETRALAVPNAALQTLPGTVVAPALQQPAEKDRDPSSTRTSGPSTQPGLYAEFFLNPNLSGQPVLTRVDPNVDFLWNNISPAPGVPVENYSIRWTGSLIAPVDGDYRLGAASDGGFRLYLDNKLLIDDWTLYGQRGERSFTVPVRLQAGHAYPIRFEYFRRFRESYARLLWLPPNLEDDAVAAARKSDVVLAIVGISADLEGEERDNSDPGFFGGDRTDIDLPRTQAHLLEALASTGKPLIVVLTSGSALAINWVNEHAAAILAAWYPGEEGGTAIADVLSGDYNPSGRLPVTFYKSLAQLPPFTSYSMANRTYRYSTENPLYPFGFGLSYSSFSYSNAAVAHAVAGTKPVSVEASAPNSSPVEISVDSRDAMTVSATVTNTSAVPGNEVAELYVSHPGIDGAPLRALVGFRRIHLDARASGTVSFLLTPRELSIVNSEGKRFVPAGPADLWMGSSQPNAPSQSGVPLRLQIATTTPVPN